MKFLAVIQDIIGVDGEEMQREISTSIHYTSPIFTKFLHHSTFQPLRERENDNVLTSRLSQRQLIYQDLIACHNRVLSHLREMMEEAHNLRQEHVNLKMANIELKNGLNSMNKATPFSASVMVPEPAKMSEYQSKVESLATPSLTDSRSYQVGRGGVERVGLLKSISVRFSGYVKGFEVGGSSRSGKIDNATKKVYVGEGKENQPLELEVFNQGMCKTELCNKWQQTGTCPYANNCQFAHDIEELRPIVRHPRYKTEVCRMVLTGVSCHYGHRCHFRHTLIDEEKIIKAMRSISLENRAVELSRGKSIFI